MLCALCLIIHKLHTVSHTITCSIDSLISELLIILMTVCVSILIDERHASVLVVALQDVVSEWMILGTHLGIQDSVLRSIQYNNRDIIQTCRRDMVIEWLKSGSATKVELVSALRKIHFNRTADDIESIPSV